MKTKLLILSLLSLSSLVSYADSCCSSTMFGAAMGTGAGAVIGHAFGGSDGAVLGAVMGGLSGAAIGHDSCHKERKHRRHHRKHRHHKHHSKRECHHHYYNEPEPVVYAPICTPVYTPIVQQRVYTQPVYVERPCTVYREVCRPREVVYSYNTVWF